MRTAIVLVTWACACSNGDAGAPDGGPPDLGPPEPWSAAVRVNADQTPFLQREVSITAAADGTWNATWMDYGEGTMFVACASAHSADGETWTAPELYRGPLPYCGDPVVTADRHGNVYRLGVSFDATVMPDFIPSHSYVQVSRSTDNGTTWGPWHTAVQPIPPTLPPAGLNDKPWMAADGERVVVVHTVLERFLFGDLLVTSSVDGGASWTIPQSIGKGIGVCTALDESGRIHAAWGNDQELKIHYRSSADGGQTWSALQKVGDTGPSASLFGDSVSLIVGCATSGEDVYLIWTGDTGGGSWDVWVVHSSDSGANWTAPIRVNDDAGDAHQVRAWIAVDAARRVHAAWIDWRTGAPEPWSAWSADGGATWSPNEMFSEGKANENGPDYNGLAASAQGEVGYAWADDRTEATGVDVYFAKRRAVPR